MLGFACRPRIDASAISLRTVPLTDLLIEQNREFGVTGDVHYLGEYFYTGQRQQRHGQAVLFGAPLERRVLLVV